MATFGVLRLRVPKSRDATLRMTRLGVRLKTQKVTILMQPRCLLTGYALFSFHDQPLKERA
jgi:hypothetical protein